MQLRHITPQSILHLLLNFEFLQSKGIFYNAHLRIKQLSKFPHQATTVHIPLSMHYIRNVRDLSVEQKNHNSVNTANF
jgi:hypothetical protein